MSNESILLKTLFLVEKALKSCFLGRSPGHTQRTLSRLASSSLHSSMQEKGEASEASFQQSQLTQRKAGILPLHKTTHSCCAGTFA